jgi:addiction module RelB/DinJ family antitoxin
MTTIVNFKTDKKIKNRAQKIASEMGLNLSDILNVCLRNFINQKTLYINLNDYETNPSPELLLAVKNARQEFTKNKKTSSLEEIFSGL